jgi:hypothetical protein
MQRGQLTAVLLVVLLVAAIGAFVIFSQKKAGKSVSIADPSDCLTQRVKCLAEATTQQERAKCQQEHAQCLAGLSTTGASNTGPSQQGCQTEYTAYMNCLQAATPAQPPIAQPPIIQPPTITQPQQEQPTAAPGTPASFLPATCEDTTVTINNPMCRSPQWMGVFQKALNEKCGTYSTGQTGPAGAPRPNCRATLQSTTATGCVYNIDCK